MAHKTLVNGTAYEISGGKTLVGGTAYEVGFGLPKAKVTFILPEGSAHSYIAIDGTEYKSSPNETTIEVPIGTVVECFVYSTGIGYPSKVFVNGELVFSEDVSKTWLTYEYTVNGDVYIMCSYSSESYRTYGTIKITEL